MSFLHNWRNHARQDAGGCDEHFDSNLTRIKSIRLPQWDLFTLWIATYIWLFTGNHDGVIRKKHWSSHFIYPIMKEKNLEVRVLVESTMCSTYTPGQRLLWWLGRFAYLASTLPAASLSCFEWQADAGFISFCGKSWSTPPGIGGSSPHRHQTCKLHGLDVIFDQCMHALSFHSPIHESRLLMWTDFGKAGGIFNFSRGFIRL